MEPKRPRASNSIRLGRFGVALLKSVAHFGLEPQKLVQHLLSPIKKKVHNVSFEVSWSQKLEISVSAIKFAISVTISPFSFL